MSGEESLHALVRTWITRRSRDFTLTDNLRLIIRRFFSLISCCRSSFLFRASCFYGVRWFIGHFSRRPCESKGRSQLYSCKLVKGKKTNLSFPIKCLSRQGVLYGHSRSSMNSYGLGSGTTQGNAPTEQTLKGYMLRRKKYFH